ncbi:MAG: agmatine deiminase family protein [bacterium]|nr:agmatine deiminase family protein [bacterium]
MSEDTFLPSDFRVPAEWEPQEAVYLTVPPDNEFDPSLIPGNRTVNDVQFDMIRALHERTSMRIIANDEAQKITYQDAMKSAGLDPSWVRFERVDHGDIWVRDTGPIWAINDSGETALVWMGFNSWGYAPYVLGDWADCDFPNYIPRDLGAVLGKPVYRTRLVGEGGDKSFNGRGSLICCKAVETDRNQDMSLPDLEELLKRSFNVDNVVWVEHGLADDFQTFRVRPEYGNAPLPGKVFTPMGTGGHIDEYCRFVGQNKVLLAQVHESQLEDMSALEQITHFNMEGNLALLRQQTDENGTPLEIVRMPLPPAMIYTIDQRDPMYFTMQQLQGVDFEGPVKTVISSSYCNYLISNGVICFPKYYRPGMDEGVQRIDQEAYEIMAGLFPGHEIVRIDPVAVNAGGGGMHCISNNQPRA